MISKNPTLIISFFGGDVSVSTIVISVTNDDIVKGSIIHIADKKGIVGNKSL